MQTPKRLAWTPAAWEDYLYWQGQDRKQLRRINQLIQACLRDPFVGIGKPELLRENLSGCWSRRIDEPKRQSTTGAAITHHNPAKGSSGQFNRSGRRTAQPLHKHRHNSGDHGQLPAPLSVVIVAVGVAAARKTSSTT